MRCRASILVFALLAAACGSREAGTPQSPEEAAREYEAAIKAGREAVGTPAANAPPASQSQGSVSGAQASFVTECAIDWRGERYVERCRYFPAEGASFAITREDGGEVVPGAASIGVFVRPDGYAVVSATDASGRAVRWGTASRAPQNDDCWEGDGFWVCAG